VGHHTKRSAFQCFKRTSVSNDAKINRSSRRRRRSPRIAVQENEGRVWNSRLQPIVFGQHEPSHQTVSGSDCDFAGLISAFGFEISERRQVSLVMIARRLPALVSTRPRPLRRTNSTPKNSSSSLTVGCKGFAHLGRHWLLWSRLRLRLRDRKCAGVQATGQIAEEFAKHYCSVMPLTVFAVERPTGTAILRSTKESDCRMLTGLQLGNLRRLPNAEHPDSAVDAHLRAEQRRQIEHPSRLALRT